MRENRFTPGEWFLEETDGTIRSKEILKSDQMADYRGTIVCSLEPALGAWPTLARGHAEPETRANAALIIAAPDLYEALTAMLEEFQPGQLPDSEDAYTPNGLKAIELARAAITKANG